MVKLTLIAVEIVFDLKMIEYTKRPAKVNDRRMGGDTTSPMSQTTANTMPYKYVYTP